MFGEILSAGGSGSTIAARQSPIPYIALMVGGIGIGIFFVVWVFTKIIRKYKQSEAYIESQKSRITTLNDVQALAKRINLTHTETMLLFNICRKEKAKNIFYTWTESDFIDEMFKHEFKRMKESGASEKDILELFKLRSRIERILLTKKAITSTYGIPEGETFDFSVFAGIEFNFKIDKSEKDLLTLRVPPDFEGKQFCPKPLTKIVLTYNSPKNIKYVISTRVIRFQPGANNTRQMVVQQTSTISMQTRRRYKRAKVGIECSFSAVEEIPGKHGAITYKPKENKYQGKLMDISGGGCNIVTKLPIKKNQKLWMEIELPGYEKIESCGIIVDVKQNIDVYSLHIAFLDINEKSRNNVFAYVYNYS